MTNPRRGGVAAAVATIGLVLAGCATPPGSTAPPSPSPVEAVAPDCPLEPDLPVPAELASRCVHEGWRANDERRMGAYGAPGVTDALPFAGDGAGFDLDGCSPADTTTGAVVCTWTVAASTSDGVEGVFVMTMRVEVASESAGYRVTSIDLEPPV